MTQPQDFAAQLRSFRASKGWNQTQLAEWLNTSQSNVSRWECGEALPRQLFRSKRFDELMRAMGATDESALERRVAALELAVRRINEVFDAMESGHHKISALRAEHLIDDHVRDTIDEAMGDAP